MLPLFLRYSKPIKLLKYIFIFCIAFLYTQLSLATFKITDASNDWIIPDSCKFYIIDSNYISSNDVVNRTFTKKINKLQTLVGKKIWIKYSIEDICKDQVNWILQLPLHNDEVEVVFSTKDSIQIYKTGQNNLFSSRQTDIRTLAFEIPNSRSKHIDVYIHLTIHEHTDLTHILINEKNYLSTHTKGYLFLGLIYGMLFLMALYNLILFISIKEKIYVYYVLYTLSSAFFLSWKDGLGFQFIWPNLPVINKYHHVLGLLGMSVSFLLYACSFLELKKNSPIFYKWFIIVIVSNVLYLVYYVYQDTSFIPIPWILLLSYISFIGISIVFMYRQFKPATYLLVSVSCIAFALIILKLRYLGLIPWNWFIEYILNYVVVIEAIIMSLAISDKLTFLRKQKEEAQLVKVSEERVKTENQLIQLRNKNLENELQYQNSQLATLATASIQKNEFISKIRKELETIQIELDNQSSIKRLIKIVDKESDYDDNWEQFKSNFDKAHNNFLTSIKERYPSLKPGDLMLCAYTKLGKSNKEIASLLFITISGVEKKRLRLKEKMNIDTDTSLYDFLSNWK